MNRVQRTEHRKAFLSFVDLSKFVNPFSVTLTLKQSVIVDYGHLRTHSRISHDRAVRNFRHFMNLLNRRMYGHGFKRHGKRVQVIPILEGGGLTRFHYHCVIDCPRPELTETFPSIITNCWSKTDYGYDQIDVQPGSDSGWLHYISKFRSKSDFDQSIDWINLHQN